MIDRPAEVMGGYRPGRAWARKSLGGEEGPEGLSIGEATHAAAR